MHNALKLYGRDNKGTNLSDLAIGYSMRAFSRHCLNCAIKSDPSHPLVDQKLSKSIQAVLNSWSEHDQNDLGVP